MSTAIKIKNPVVVPPNALWVCTLKGCDGIHHYWEHV